MKQAQLADDLDEGDDLDLSGLLWFADQVLDDLARNWEALEISGKRGVLQVLFAENLTLAKKQLRTGRISPLFRHLRAANFGESRLASPTGFEPVLSP